MNGAGFAIQTTFCLTAGTGVLEETQLFSLLLPILQALLNH
jgi:hypothetical protein